MSDNDTAFKEQINRFLSDIAGNNGEGNEIIAIKGAWGAGKTYAWKHYLEQAKKADQIHLKKYAYVSLYGLNSIEDLRRAIFESVIGTKLINDKTSLDTKLTNTWSHFCSILRRWSHRISGLIGATPFYGLSLDGIAKSITAQGVSNTLICLDDLERKGKSLELSDVFGLVNHLRESRGCRVALILNSEKLDEKNYYDTLSEKTIDREIFFNPSFYEAFEIAFDKHEIADIRYIKTHSFHHNICNIRILKKIRRNVEHFSKGIAEITLSDSTRDAIYRALVIQTYCYYGHKIYDDVPRLESFDKAGQTFNPHMFDSDHKDRKLIDFLTDSGYLSTQELEVELANYVRTSVFNTRLPILVAEREQEIGRIMLNARINSLTFSVHRKFHYEHDNPLGEIGDLIATNPTDVEPHVISYFWILQIQLASII